MNEEGIRLGDIVSRLGGELRGDAQRRVSCVGALDSAGADALSFLANPRYRNRLAETHAGCVILGAQDAEACPVPVIVAADPYVYYARAAALLADVHLMRAGVHPDASVDAAAEIHPGAWIGACAVVAAQARVSDGAFVGPGCVLGEGVEIGERSRLVANVTVLARAHIGSDCLLHPGVVIGADGFGIAWDGERWLKVPQLGGVRIGNQVEIGANTAIDCGAIGDTVIEDGVKLDNLIQIGHNVHIGAHTVMAGCTGVSGSATIGARCQIGGQVGIAGHISIADDTVITGKSVVNHSIHEPGGRYSGALPMEESRSWRRNSARFRSLDEFARRLKRLERLNRDKGT